MGFSRSLPIRLRLVAALVFLVNIGRRKELVKSVGRVRAVEVEGDGDERRGSTAGEGLGALIGEKGVL